MAFWTSSRLNELKTVATMHCAAFPLLFGLLAAAHAVPTLPRRSLSETPPPRSSEFSLAMKLNGVNGTYAPLNAVYLENRGILLRAADMTGGPGTPGALINHVLDNG